MKISLRIILTITLVSVLAIGLVLGGCSSESNAEGPSLGMITNYTIDYSQRLEADKPAPDFQFQNPDGQVMFLSDLKGKAVLINFWQVRCPPCVYEMPHLQQIYDEWTDKGLELLAINVGETSSTVKRFLQSRDLSLPVILDKGWAVASLYGIRYFPTTLLLDTDGAIQGAKIGPFQGKEEIEAGIRTVIP